MFLVVLDGLGRSWTVFISPYHTYLVFRVFFADPRSRDTHTDRHISCHTHTHTHTHRERERERTDPIVTRVVNTMVNHTWREHVEVIGQEDTLDKTVNIPPLNDTV